MKTPNVIFIFLGLLVGCQKNQSQDRELFVFEADERLFTAGAFINVGGYDLEYNDGGMQPIRAELRAELSPRLGQAYQDSIRQYYSSHDHYLGYYETFALLLSKPPEFSLKYDPRASDAHIAELVNALPGLDHRLAEFYRRANIHELWEKHRPAIQARVDQYRPHAQQALDDLIAYFRTNKEVLQRPNRKLVTTFNPLMSYFTAFTVTVNNDFYFVYGPQPGEPSASSYYHEVMHHIADSIVEKYMAKSNDRSELLTLAKEKLPNATWDYIVTESFVRAISHVLEGKLHKSSDEEVKQAIANEYKLGYLLCHHFFENLPAYEKSNEPMETYFAKLMAGVDIEKERVRWLEVCE